MPKCNLKIESIMIQESDDGEILDLNIDKNFSFRRHIKSLARIAHEGGLENS